MFKKSNEEIILKHLPIKYKNGKKSEVTFDMNDVTKLKLSEDEAVRAIFMLETNVVLIIKRKSIHNNFNMFWSLEITSLGFDFLTIKEKIKEIIEPSS